MKKRKRLLNEEQVCKKFDVDIEAFRSIVENRTSSEIMYILSNLEVIEDLESYLEYFNIKYEEAEEGISYIKYRSYMSSLCNTHFYENFINIKISTKFERLLESMEDE